MGRKIVLLGSTGSIGTQTLDVARANPDDIKVVGIAANRSVDKVEQQVREFRPKYVAMYVYTPSNKLIESKYLIASIINISIR